ncbi:MAG: hypothetical protein ACYDHY_03710 [Acidiferrobacterales bacterium]
MMRTAARESAKCVAVLIAVTPPVPGAFRGNIVFFFSPVEARADHAPPGWQVCIVGLAAEFVAINNHWRIPVRYTEFSTFPE